MYGWGRWITYVITACAPTHTFSGKLAYPARGYTHYRHAPPSHSGWWGVTLIYLPLRRRGKAFAPLFPRK
nr:MAG TPA: hypothetical protein [Caudoviricetes sp.]